MKCFFFAAGSDLAQIFDYVCEEYERRLRRGLLREQNTPFCDLLYSMVDLGTVSPSLHPRIALVH